MGSPLYKRFHRIYSVFLSTLVVLSIWGGIIAIIMEPQQVTTGWVAELPNASAIYFPAAVQTSAPGMFQAQSEIRRPTKALRNSYIALLVFNTILGGVAEVFYFINFETTFIAVVMVWATAGFVNTGPIAAPNAKYLKDYLFDLGQTESEVLKLLELDLMFQLLQIRSKMMTLESSNQTNVSSTNSNSSDEFLPVALQLATLEQEAVEDLKKVASKIAGLKYKKICYSERGCNLAKHYCCVYRMSIFSTMMYIAMFLMALYTGWVCKASSNDEQPSDSDDNGTPAPAESNKRKFLIVSSRPSRPGGDDSSAPRGAGTSIDHPQEDFTSTLGVSESPSVV